MSWNSLRAKRLIKSRLTTLLTSLIARQGSDSMMAPT